MASVAPTSSAPARRTTLKCIFSRIFSKKVSKSLLKTSELEAEVEKFKTALRAEQEKNDCLTLENQVLREKLTDREEQLKEQKLASDTQSENHLGIIEKLSKEKVAMISELEHDKAQLVCKLQTAHQKLTEFRNAQTQHDEIENFNESVRELEKERSTLKTIRQKNEELAKKQLKKEVEKNGEDFTWQCCEICMEKYSHKEENSPRILACGHTVCLSCAKRLSEKDVIKCPFDRLGTRCSGKIEDELPKNFAILKMC